MTEIIIFNIYIPSPMLNIRRYQYITLFLYVPDLIKLYGPNKQLYVLHQSQSWSSKWGSLSHIFYTLSFSRTICTVEHILGGALEIYTYFTTMLVCIVSNTTIAVKSITKTATVRCPGTTRRLTRRCPQIAQRLPWRCQPALKFK